MLSVILTLLSGGVALIGWRWVGVGSLSVWLSRGLRVDMELVATARLELAPPSVAFERTMPVLYLTDGRRIAVSELTGPSGSPVQLRFLTRVGRSADSVQSRKVARGCG